MKLNAIKKSILKYRAKVVQPKRISIDQYNKEIDEAVKDIENGEYFTHEEALKIASKW